MLLKSINIIALVFINISICYCQSEIKSSVNNKPPVSEKAREYYKEASNSYKKKDFEKAIELLELSIATDSNLIISYSSLGMAFRQLNMLDSAEYYYQISYSKEPANASVIQELGFLAESKKDVYKAMYYYNKLIDLEKENPEGYYGACRMQLAIGKNEVALKNALLAEKYYKQINSPYIGECYYILCLIYAKMKNIPMEEKYIALCREEGVDVAQKLQEDLNK